MESSYKTLVCRLEGQRAAFVLTQVEEVVPVARLSLLPESPHWVAGVLDLRGEMVPVIDTAMRLFGRPYRRRNLGDLIMICRVSKAVKAGLIVDSVHEIECVERSSLQLPGDGYLVYEPYLLGVYTVGGESTLLMSPEALIAVSNIEVEPK